jgi:hypothetical protein
MQLRSMGSESITICPGPAHKDISCGLCNGPWLLRNAAFVGACAEIDKINTRLKAFDCLVNGEVYSSVISKVMLKNLHNIFQKVSLLNSTNHPNRFREYRELRAAARNWVVQKEFPDILVEILGLNMERPGNMERVDRSIPDDGLSSTSLPITDLPGGGERYACLRRVR